MSSGIYRIYNKVNKKFYIGSAYNFDRRKREHLNLLLNNKHYNSKLQRAWNKYKSENFIIELIANCPREYCRKLEQWFIDNLKPCYNIAILANSPGGLKHNKATKLKISKARKGEGNGMYGKNHTETAIEKIRNNSLQRKNNIETISALKLGHGWNKGIAFSEEAKIKMSLAKDSVKKKVKRIAPNGAEYIYNCIADTKKEGFNSSHVSNCCKGKQGLHKNYKWEFVYASR